MSHQRLHHRPLMTALAAVALLAVSTLAHATPLHFVAHYTPLNNSGVTGTAKLTLDMDTLTVTIMATGLAAGFPHPTAIHGPLDGSGNAVNATTPTMALDANGDGVLEVTESFAALGGTLLLFPPPFSTAPGGVINFTHMYDLTASGTLMPGVTESNLFPLDLRELDIHGGFAPVDITNGFLDGKTFYAAGTYVPLLPVASAEIVAVVPEPASAGMLIAGLGLLFGFLGLRKRGQKGTEGINVN